MYSRVASGEGGYWAEFDWDAALRLGIVGGLLMGVGFIVGGFCPGTSLVAVATLKLDGLFFFMGVTAGVFFFGETISGFENFWYSSSMGRFTLPDWLGVDAGWVVLGVVIMALFIFWGSEKLERMFGGPISGFRGLPVGFRRLGALGLLGIALLAVIPGQPTAEDRWACMPEMEELLLSRSVQIYPGELRDLMGDHGIDLVIHDVRGEGDFNVFHLVDSRRVAMGDIRSGAVANGLLVLQENAVVVIVDNAEVRAPEAWKLLAAQSVANLYLLEGGLNAWLDLFGHSGHEQCGPLAATAVEDSLQHRFDAAMGSRYPSANPDLQLNPMNVSYDKKVKLQRKTALGGGCG